MSESLLAAALSFPTLRRRRIAAATTTYNENDRAIKRARQDKRENEEARMLALIPHHIDMIQKNLGKKNKDHVTIHGELMQEIAKEKKRLQQASVDKELVKLVTRRALTSSQPQDSDSEDLSLALLRLQQRIESLRMEERVIIDYCARLMKSNRAALERIHRAQDTESSATTTSAQVDVGLANALRKECMALTTFLTTLVLESGVDWDHDKTLKQIMMGS